MKRLCPRHGPQPAGAPCTSCQRERWARRGGTGLRGYGAAHQRARRELALSLPAPCGYCGTWLTPDADWVAAHLVDGDPDIGWIAACPGCNDRARMR